MTVEEIAKQVVNDYQHLRTPQLGCGLLESLVIQAIKDAVEEECEACAKLVSKCRNGAGMGYIAQLIRNRK